MIKFKDLGMILLEQSEQLTKIASDLQANEYVIIPVEQINIKAMTIDDAISEAYKQKTPHMVVKLTSFIHGGCSSKYAIVNNNRHKWHGKQVKTGIVNRSGLVRCTYSDNNSVDFIHISKLIYL